MWPLLLVLILVLEPFRFEFDPKNESVLNAFITTLLLRFSAGDGETRNGEGTEVRFSSGLERARGNVGAGAGAGTPLDTVQEDVLTIVLFPCPLLIIRAPLKKDPFESDIFGVGTGCEDIVCCWPRGKENRP